MVVAVGDTGENEAYEAWSATIGLVMAAVSPATSETATRKAEAPATASSTVLEPIDTWLVWTRVSTKWGGRACGPAAQDLHAVLGGCRGSGSRVKMQRHSRGSRRGHCQNQQTQQMVMHCGGFVRRMAEPRAEPRTLRNLEGNPLPLPQNPTNANKDPLIRHDKRQTASRP